MTPEQTKHIKPVIPISVRHLLSNNHDDAIHYINSLMKTSKIEGINETYWFPTPQNPGNEREQAHSDTYSQRTPGALKHRTIKLTTRHRLPKPFCTTSIGQTPH